MVWSFFDWWYRRLLCPVVHCMSLPRFDLFSSSTCLLFLLDILSQNCFVCLQVPLYCHLVCHCWFVISDIIVFISECATGGFRVFVLIVVACLAKESASSFPSWPTWALIHTRLHLLALWANSFTECTVSLTVLDVISLLFNAFKAAWLSLKNLIYFIWELVSQKIHRCFSDRYYFCLKNCRCFR